MTVWILGYALIGALLMLLAMWAARPSTSKDFDAFLYAVRYPDGIPLSERFGEWVVMGLAGLLIISIWPLLLPWWFYERFKPSPPPARLDDRPRFHANTGNLVEPVTVESVEAGEIVHDPLHAAPAIPFGHLNATWEQFKAGIQADDELWSFDTRLAPAEEAWRTAKGYALRRGGAVVAEIVAEGG
jgi:hypothetical protein